MCGWVYTPGAGVSLGALCCETVCGRVWAHVCANCVPARCRFFLFLLWPQINIIVNTLDFRTHALSQKLLSCVYGFASPSRLELVAFSAWLCAASWTWWATSTPLAAKPLR